MIALIISLSVIEIIAGLWLITKLCEYTKLVSEVNTELKQSGFTGNLAPLRISLMHFNEKMQLIQEEEQKESENHNIMQTINAILVIVPFIQMLFFRKKHK